MLYEERYWKGFGRKYYLPGGIGEKHKRPQSRQLVFELGTAYSITVRPACLLRALYRGILNGVTL
jgi:hypothetical protein